MGNLNSIPSDFNYNTRQDEINKIVNDKKTLKQNPNTNLSGSLNREQTQEVITQETYLNKFRYLFDILNQYNHINIYDSQLGETNKDILAKLTNINKKQTKQVDTYNTKYYTQKNIYKQNQTILRNKIFINKMMKYSNIVLVLILFGMLIYKMSIDRPSTIVQQN
jgi:hypothetical protein